MARICKYYDLGLTPYQWAWSLQAKMAEKIAAGTHSPTLLLLEHSPIYTFGRRGDIKNLLWNEDELARKGIEVLWVDRGGDVTYHGPGQLVGYPLLPLAPGGINMHFDPNSQTPHLPQADYIGYLRKLESTLIRTLMHLGVVSGQVNGLTGVWVQPHVPSRCINCDPESRQKPAKIASIGVKVDVNGVSRHGFSLNVDPDMSYWEGIIGCGLEQYPIASLAAMMDPPPLMTEVAQKVIQSFGEEFGYEMVEADKDELQDFLER